MSMNHVHFVWNIPRLISHTSKILAMSLTVYVLCNSSVCFSTLETYTPSSNPYPCLPRHIETLKSRVCGFQAKPQSRYWSHHDKTLTPLHSRCLGIDPPAQYVRQGPPVPEVISAAILDFSPQTAKTRNQRAELCGLTVLCKLPKNAQLVLMRVLQRHHRGAAFLKREGGPCLTQFVYVRRGKRQRKSPISYVLCCTYNTYLGTGRQLARYASHAI